MNFSSARGHNHLRHCCDRSPGPCYLPGPVCLQWVTSGSAGAAKQWASPRISPAGPLPTPTFLSAVWTAPFVGRCWASWTPSGSAESVRGAPLQGSHRAEPGPWTLLELQWDHWKISNSDLVWRSNWNKYQLSKLFHSPFVLFDLIRGTSKI